MKIVLQQAIIPDYRMGLFRLLREEWGDAFEIYAGDVDFGGSPVSTEVAWDHFQYVENHYVFGGRFLWQSGSFGQLLAADVAILNGNMRMLSNVSLIILRRLLGRRTVLWGHAEGKNAFAARFRGLYLRSCSGFIAYTQRQAQQLRGRYPFLRVWVAANACVHAKDCGPADARIEEVNTILYVGRLVEAKKVQLLLQGFIDAKRNAIVPEDVRLVFVGDGAERSLLEAGAQAAGLSECVEFAGHVSNVNELRRYYARALCTVSPGYVGLSATQSFSFGVPMLVARDEFHSPEIEACREGFNTVYFESDCSYSMALGLRYFRDNKAAFLSKRQEVADWTAANYSFDNMRDTFLDVVTHNNYYA